MSTTIEYGSEKSFWVFMVIGLALIIGALVSVVPDATKETRALSEYCDQYAESTVDKLPAKCVVYFER